MPAKSGNSRLCAISSQKIGGELPLRLRLGMGDKTFVVGEKASAANVVKLTTNILSSVCAAFRRARAAINTLWATELLFCSASTLA
jgi:hypothetical protein